MSVQSGPSRRNLPRAERRQQILDAALRAFLKGGYEGTHVEQIVKEAGVARGTFYLHFLSKHEVFAALVERMLRIFLEARPQEPEPEIRTRADAEAVLRMSYRAILETFRAHRGLVRLFLDEAVGIGRGFRHQLEAHYATWHSRVSHLLQVFVDRGIARPDLDVDLTAEMVIGMVVRVTQRYLLTDEDVDLDGLVDSLVAFELAGIGKP